MADPAETAGQINALLAYAATDPGTPTGGDTSLYNAIQDKFVAQSRGGDPSNADWLPSNPRNCPSHRGQTPAQQIYFTADL